MYQRILVAIDGSEHANHALNSAVESAAKWGAELIILTVIPPTYPLFYSEEVDAHYIDDLEGDLEQYHQRLLSEAEEMVKNRNPNLKFVMRLGRGRPSSVIVTTANVENVDLIVMGSRGLGGVTGWVLGSTSRRVVETCEKPILIVK